MNQEERKEISDLIHLSLQGSTARIESKIDIVDNNQKQTNEHLKKINGRLTSHDDIIAGALQERSKNRQSQEDEIKRLDTKIDNHSLTCPQDKRITDLEKTDLISETITITKKQLTGLVFKTLGAVVAILTIFEVILPLFTNL